MMRFIIDTNLTPGLAVWLRSQGHEAHHTSDLGLGQATDRAISSRGKADGAIVVTKDEDFVLLKTMDPAGPQVVWIRIGNAVNRVLLQRLDVAWPSVVEKLSKGEPVVELT